jgi:hypothetical protein
MANPTPLKINIQSPIRDLRVDYSDKHNCWRIWLTANGDFTLGTFIQLDNNSTVHRVTWHPDGTESIFDITNK